MLIACDVSLPSEKYVNTRLDLLPLVVRAIAEGRPTLILVGRAMGVTAPSAGAGQRHADRALIDAG